jgi:hypothetical protein
MRRLRVVVSAGVAAVLAVFSAVSAALAGGGVGPFP